ncbi:MAG: hypothetical protein Pyrs2KO_31050 [Pyruvatibacter sp.]
MLGKFLGRCLGRTGAGGCVDVPAIGKIESNGCGHMARSLGLAPDLAANDLGFETQAAYLLKSGNKMLSSCDAQNRKDFYL